MSSDNFNINNNYNNRRKKIHVVTVIRNIQIKKCQDPKLSKSFLMSKLSSINVFNFYFLLLQFKSY